MGKGRGDRDKRIAAAQARASAPAPESPAAEGYEDLLTPEARKLAGKYGRDRWEQIRQA